MGKARKSGEGAKEWGRRESVRREKIGTGQESFLPCFFFFRVRAFSIPRARLSRRLGQATLKVMEEMGCFLMLQKPVLVRYCV